jgi:hypothetical protein
MLLAHRVVHLSLLTLCSVACNRYELASRLNDLRGDGYALDAVPRDVAADAQPTCPPSVAVVPYRGSELAYGRTVLVAAAFEPKLRAFEQLVLQLARERYGRVPERLLHFGVRACRRVRGTSRRLSEHALANALDVAGFRFGRASERLPSHLPASLQGPFTATILRHWQPASADAADQLHSRFLHELVERVRRQGGFRGIVGPGREGHADHLHFDYAPWRYTLL